MSSFTEFHLCEDALIITPIPGPRSSALLRRQTEIEGNGVSYPKGMPIAIRRARGAIIEDLDGNRLIDFFAFCGVVNVGHCNHEVLEAVERQQHELIHAMDFPTLNKLNYIENILQELPASIRDQYKVMFCASTGADAIEAAVKLAKLKTGRDSVIAFQGGYHGVTAGAVSLTTHQKHRGGLSSFMPNVHFIPYGYCYRCPAKKTPDSCAFDCVDILRDILENPCSGIAKPAAVVIEPVQGEGGTIVPKEDYIKRITELAQQHGVTVILDEIQCGFYRTGTFVDFAGSGAAPDVITMSKGLGGVGLPLSAIIYKKEMDVWVPGFHVGTFRGNQASIAAGNAALAFIHKYNLASHAQEMGAYMIECLDRLKADFEMIGDVRGRGLFVGVEFVRDRDSKAPASEFVERVRQACVKRGLLFEVGGHYSNVVRFNPPLIVNKTIIINALKIFVDALEEVTESISAGIE